MQILRLLTVHMKINQIPYAISKAQVSFPLNFGSPFSVMTHNSYEIFQLKHMLWTKRAHQSTIFQTFQCSNESSPNFLMPFLKPKGQGLFKFCITGQCHER